jgi:hypothetical protein
MLWVSVDGRILSLSWLFFVFSLSLVEEEGEVEDRVSAIQHAIGIC